MKKNIDLHGVANLIDLDQHVFRNDPGAAEAAVCCLMAMSAPSLHEELLGIHGTSMRSGTSGGPPEPPDDTPPAARASCRAHYIYSIDAGAAEAAVVLLYAYERPLPTT